MCVANIIWRRNRENHFLNPRKSIANLEGKIVNFLLPDRNSIFHPYPLQICVATQKWYWPRKIVANTHRISILKFGSNLAIKIAQFKTLEPLTDKWLFRGYVYQPRVTRVVTDSITGKTQGIIGYSRGHDCSVQVWDLFATRTLSRAESPAIRSYVVGQTRSITFLESVHTGPKYFPVVSRNQYPIRDQVLGSRTVFLVSLSHWSVSREGPAPSETY